MALDLKALGKKIALGVNTASVVFAALQATGALAALPPSLLAYIVGALAVLNGAVHAIPNTAPPAA